MTHVNRLRAAVDAALITLADWIMPPVPALDAAAAERMYQRLMARLALESMGDRRNGHHPPPIARI